MRACSGFSMRALCDAALEAASPGTPPGEERLIRPGEERLSNPGRLLRLSPEACAAALAKCAAARGAAAAAERAGAPDQAAAAVPNVDTERRDSAQQGRLAVRAHLRTLERLSACLPDPMRCEA